MEAQAGQEARAGEDLEALREIFLAVLDEGLLSKRPRVVMGVERRGPWASAYVTVELETAKIVVSYDLNTKFYTAGVEPKYDCGGDAEGCPLPFGAGASGRTPKEAIEGLRRKVRELLESVERLDEELTDAVAGEDSSTFTMVRDAIDATEWSILEAAEALGLAREG